MPRSHQPSAGQDVPDFRFRRRHRRLLRVQRRGAGGKVKIRARTSSGADPAGDHGTALRDNDGIRHRGDPGGERQGKIKVKRVIIRAVPTAETGSATASTRCSATSACMVKVLWAWVVFPPVRLFGSSVRTGNPLLAGLGLLTAFLSFVLSGAAPDGDHRTGLGSDPDDVEVRMAEEAPLDATGAMLVDELDLDAGTGDDHQGRARGRDDVGSGAAVDAHGPPPRRPTGRRCHAGQALLGAAQDLFGHKGYERTTTREIGEAAGVKRPGPHLALLSGPRPTCIWPRSPRSGSMTTGSRGTTGPMAPFDDLAQVVQVVLRRDRQAGAGTHPPGVGPRRRLGGDPGRRATARLERRMVGPIALDYEAAGLDRPTLRAQVSGGGPAGGRARALARVVRMGVAHDGGSRRARRTRDRAPWRAARLQAELSGLPRWRRRTNPRRRHRCGLTPLA